MSEYEGKKIELTKRVYSFIRDLRVLDFFIQDPHNQTSQVCVPDSIGNVLHFWFPSNGLSNF